MQFAEWHRASVSIDDETFTGPYVGELAEEGDPELGAEILDSTDWGCGDGLVSDVGGDPFGGAWPMNVND